MATTSSQDLESFIRLQKQKLSNDRNDVNNFYQNPIHISSAPSFATPAMPPKYYIQPQAFSAASNKEQIESVKLTINTIEYLIKSIR